MTEIKIHTTDKRAAELVERYIEELEYLAAFAEGCSFEQIDSETWVGTNEEWDAERDDEAMVEAFQTAYNLMDDLLFFYWEEGVPYPRACVVTRNATGVVNVLGVPRRVHSVPRCVDIL